MKRVGVLAAQGAFAEHLACFQRLGVEAILVRLPCHLERLEALVIPGGESTSIARLMEDYGLAGPISSLARQGLPLWGTCAGLILLAKGLKDPYPQTLGLMDMEVKRNAFGRQRESFEKDLAIPALGDPPFHAVFIRAPYIIYTGPEVEVLGRLEDGRVVAAREGNLLATAFHPELTPDLRFHAYFLKMADQAK